MSRIILHVDLDAFFCSVEQLLDPSLEGKPFVVGGRAEARGVVSSASYAARTFGISSAMATARALRLCSDLIVLPPRHHIYSEQSRKVMALLRSSAPIFEQFSIDEAFLDVSDDPRPGAQVASILQIKIRERFGLPTSWGVASNKLVAKIATEIGKPEGLITVPPGKEAAFLAPLPVEMLWGVGPKTRSRLVEQGIRTIGELAGFPGDRLLAIFGVHGSDLATKARGQDERPVAEDREPRSMSSEVTFERDIADKKELSRTLMRLSEKVGRRLRKAKLTGRTVKIKLRWPDFTTLTRQVKLSQPTDQDGEIFQTALRLFERVWRKGRAVRLLGVGVADLGRPLRQLTLFDRTWEQDASLLNAIDDIRTRYGKDALRRAGDLKQKGTRGLSHRGREERD
jgi:DNA polymerase-4